MRSKNFLWLISLPLIAGLVLASFTLKDEIVLNDDPLKITPAGFYIAAVSDDRASNEAIAMLAVAAANKKPEIHQADLQGGLAKGIDRFISRNLKRDTTARAINISIKDFKLTETILPNGGVDGRIQLSLSFGQPKDYGVQQLVLYRGGLHYVRPLANTGLIEAQLRGAIKSSLVYFNNWMLNNLNTNPILANSVSFTFTDYNDEAEGDTIYYTAARRLKWNDFQSKIRPPGPFNAVVMPNFGYNLTREVKNGVINVCLEMKTYLAKSDSWTDGSRDAYGLNHEQRHFDIAHVITRQFQKKILASHLTPDTYEAFINMQYLDSYRDMNAMQKAYDKETRHGVNEPAQAEWNKKIDALLKE